CRARPGRRQAAAHASGRSRPRQRRRRRCGAGEAPHLVHGYRRSVGAAAGGCLRARRLGRPVTQLPKINELVLVRTGSPESVLRSRVEDAAPGVLTIAHPSDGLTAHRLATSTRVTLEWLVERGIGTVTGVVSAHVDIGIPALTVQLNTTPVVYQRR